MIKKGVSLRGLEVFEILADTGSVAATAQRTGLSQPSVSQQMRNLEAALGSQLLDHGKRPMRLTSAGASFLIHARSALGALRSGQADLSAMDLSHLSVLDIAIIDDFDNDLAPSLATALANKMADSSLRLRTAHSLEILAAVQKGDVHLGVTATDGAPQANLAAYPLAREPLILVVPRGASTTVERDLPFLAYNQDQLIARLTNTYFAAVGRQVTSRFEIGAPLALLSLVARGVGWTVTTPCAYMRAERMHEGIEVRPLPLVREEREITVLAHPEWDRKIPAEIASMLRRLIDDQIIVPALERLPWLNGRLRLLQQTPS